MVYWLDFVNLSPPGFYGKDVAIDIISALVVLSIGFFSFKNFMLDTKNKKQLLLSSAFLMLAASFIVKIATNILTHTETASELYHLYLAGGFLAHLFLTLFGFYILYALTSKDDLTMNYVIMAYFILILTYFARFNYHWFYITAVIFLLAATRRYILSYRKFRYKNTKLLAISFGIITLSQIFFIFTYADRWVYVAGEAIQLIGYCFLLYTFAMVLKNARKKK
ncbi:hypothetical protein JW711_05110 [Candidatus Woesearchaeota archaeon]|nr:hypothetical protein [Candidatus Woesearchaeota archaeon]